MRKLDNKEEIGSICFTKTVHPYCTLGADYYSAEIIVDMECGKYYPEYCEVDAAIQAFGGKPLTVEQLAEKVYEMMEQYEPIAMYVEVKAESNKHFPVTVQKRMGY